jgi:predicted ester cyclase
MTAAAIKTATRTYFEQLLNHGNNAAADTILAPDIQFHYPLADLDGADAVKAYVAAVRKAFPDIVFTVDTLISEGEHVAARWSLVGSQTGEFRGQAPTGRRVNVPGNTIFRFVDGKIKEMWVAFGPAQFVKSQD